MKILLTGASSFTGLWFSKELTERGHEVVVPLRGSASAYGGLRKSRIEQLENFCRPVFDCSFGSPSFMQLLNSADHWDLFCHHAADVTDYKSSNFDPAAALANNTHNLRAVLQILREKGCSKIVLTGSVFEQNEGIGELPLMAVSPYGLSKGLTSDFFQYYGNIFKFNLGKFVIPNPFGPYEESRFTTYLIKSWRKGEIPSVNTPDYVRDNIPVTLLAKAYCSFCENLSSEDPFQKFNPSFYKESQGDFTARFAKEMASRLGIKCSFELKPQIEFLEPRMRVNFDVLDPSFFKWNESKAWDELADYYSKHILTESL